MPTKSCNWLKAGILMSILNAAILLFYGKLLGASTAYVSVAANFLKYIIPDFVSKNPYFKQTPMGFTFEIALMIGIRKIMKEAILHPLIINTSMLFEFSSSLDVSPMSLTTLRQSVKNFYS